MSKLFKAVSEILDMTVTTDDGASKKVKDLVSSVTIKASEDLHARGAVRAKKCGVSGVVTPKGLMECLADCQDVHRAQDVSLYGRKRK